MALSIVVAPSTIMALSTIVIACKRTPSPLQREASVGIDLSHKNPKWGLTTNPWSVKFFSNRRYEDEGLKIEFLIAK